MNISIDPIVLLVDSHHGQYSANCLVEAFFDRLYMKLDRIDPQGKKLDNDYLARFSYALEYSQWLEDESKETVFNPDNSHCDENIEYCFYLAGLYIQNDNGQLWRVEFIDGDIFAIHPNSVWNEETESYVFEE